MELRTVVRDCLYLNWALPASAMPKLPEPLRYQTVDGDEGPVAFASALLFRQQGLALTRFPVPRLSYPQLNLRSCVLDGAGTPSVFFWAMLAPAWVTPGARWVARQPTSAARFDYPPLLDDELFDRASWEVSSSGRLRVEASGLSGAAAATGATAGPVLGDWLRTSRFFRERPKGYSLGPRGELRRSKTVHEEVAVWPVAAEVTEASLLERLLPIEPWPPLHSSFLCPEIPFVFELGRAPRWRSLRRPAVATDAALRENARLLPHPPSFDPCRSGAESAR